ncbi:MAG: efflux RND transporter periplasmic adaptor subunit [Gammaproteobacteria bacterium]|nr:efflux RND transporter periplasmic adaptor subunit [Gammaproteobacteria bacterium]MBU1647598.1 efflux RND transporter periplasmic adaptor subunit [Gammaproteobacteria bacterium]MBU1971487.1 efflux RND transporter periplasmic adaptor subunit [Gammaproteobacteria bacterium]
MHLTLLAAGLILASPALAVEPPPAAVPPAPTFRTEPLEKAATFPERTAPAGVVSANESRLSAEIAARIVALPAEVGQVLAAGSVVARLDDRDGVIEIDRAEAALAGAGARLAQAESQLRRTRELAAKNFVSPEALHQKQTDADARRADQQAAAAAVAAARRVVAKATIRAPFRAVVRARHAAVGEMAAPGTPLLTLVDLSRLEIAAQVPSLFAATLAGAKEILWESGGRREPLKLLRISPAINREARSVEVRLAFRGATLAPGLEGRIVWRDPRPHMAPELIVRRDGALGVFLVEAGKARFVPLPEAQEGRPANAESLPAASQVVVSGQQALRDGVALK